MTKQESILVEQQFFRSRRCRRRGRLVSTAGSLDGCRGRLPCVLQAPQDARTKTMHRNVDPKLPEDTKTKTRGQNEANVDRIPRARLNEPTSPPEKTEEPKTKECLKQQKSPRYAPHGLACFRLEDHHARLESGPQSEEDRFKSVPQGSDNVNIGCWASPFFISPVQVRWWVSKEDRQVVDTDGKPIAFDQTKQSPFCDGVLLKRWIFFKWALNH